MSPEATPNRVLETLLAALGMNAGYVVDVYEHYVADPDGVGPEWRSYFERLERGEGRPEDLPSAAATTPRVAPAAPRPAPPADAAPFLIAPEDTLEPLRGGGAVIVRNMEQSLAIPTASSYRTFPVKLLEENRRLINHHHELSGRPRISFTHLVAWAVVQAVKAHPRLNDAFLEVEGTPHRVRRAAVNLGVAVDLSKKDGSRTLLVPNIRGVEAMDFAGFVDAYNLTLERARTGKLVPEDFQGTTISLTNPGTVGTTFSAPRLMPGQGAIVAAGAIAHAAENAGMSETMLSELGVSRRLVVSCTYDHRIIQGAESGEFLAAVEALLKGEDRFYDRVFEDLGLPYRPVRWRGDEQSGLWGGGAGDASLRNSRVLQLINAYRVRGHLIADLDPLGTAPQYHPELDPEHYGLTVWDLDRTFFTGGLVTGSGRGDEEPRATLREILETLRATYCGRIGVEYMNIQDPEQKRWLQDRMEPARNQEPLEDDLKRRILAKLISAAQFEKFLHAKFVGHKRFSLEGAETLIAVLDQLFEEASADGVREVVMGMAHRGRLNVVTQSLAVLYERIFASFQGTPDPWVTQGSGDVKYHLGATGVHHASRGENLKLTLSPNPSHLEAVDPVVEGIARAKQDRMGPEEGRRRILPVLIHGDAAFAGQGVVAEVLNFAQLPGYRTGGTIHVIVNNQIGFTTPVEGARSSPYATDIAKMGQCPIIHVNGDDPEAAVRAVRLAFAYRQRFQKDVVLDMFCYRRHGHNEGDEPSFTQPRMYAKIRNRPPVDRIYAEDLVRRGVVTGESVEHFAAGARECLELSFDKASGGGETMQPAPVAPEAAAHPDAPAVPRPTAIPPEMLERIVEVLSRLPADVDVHPKLVRHVTGRRAVFEKGEGFDWAFAEALAFGSLVLEGAPVRLSGEDSVRGTFSQRHLMLYDDDTDSSWVALKHLSPDQAAFLAIDSPLSEEGVLGFEYGYSIAAPEALVLWEAQFGDFVNEAQVVIDQFLAGAEAKWGQPSGLVLLLPHGYEGQGPEHSSARLERFLQIAAEENIQVANCSTPAQYFHVLRRQMCEGIRKPLVLMTPKSLLRHPRAVSSLADFTEGAFRRVIHEPTPKPARRVVFCSGKLVYDLRKGIEQGDVTDVALVRVEQLYPFPEAELLAVLREHPDADLVWAQEEPKNMGAWAYMKLTSDEAFPEGRRLRYVGRKASASTATGYHSVHNEEQARIVADALAP